MKSVSPAPLEVGVFDTEEASLVAIDIQNGKYPCERTDYSGRLVVPEDTINEIEDRIELLTVDDFIKSEDRQILRTRAYAQLFPEIEPSKFTGYPWHVDIEGSLHTPRPIEFYFGSSSHPTKFFVGSLDLGEVSERIIAIHPESFDSNSTLSLPAILKFGGCLVQTAIDESVEKGDGRILEAHPGVVYKIQTGGIHRMAEFNPDDSYPARFCIEKYLKRA